jgi:homoserine kinase
VIKVCVPATSANLGPGFDVLGMALAIYNYFSIEEIESGVKIEISPDNDSGLATNERNLVYRSAIRLFDEAGYRYAGLRIIIENVVPVGRGLGSSSTAIVGGLIAANELCGKPLEKDDIFNLATEIEGHPDNVAPAIYGGFTICYENETGFKAVSQAPASSIKPVLIIPGTKLETRKARGVLPDKLSMKDAIFNISRTALVTSAIINGSAGLLKDAMEDKLHQPYRAPLVPGLMEIIEEVSEIPGMGVALSGAGPSILCLTGRNDEQNTVGAIEGVVRRLGFDYRVVGAEFDLSGAFLDAM